MISLAMVLGGGLALERKRLAELKMRAVWSDRDGQETQGHLWVHSRLQAYQSYNYAGT